MGGIPAVIGVDVNHDNFFQSYQSTRDRARKAITVSVNIDLHGIVIIEPW